MVKKTILVAIIVIACFFSFSRDLDEIKRSGVIYAAFTESSYKSVNYKIAQEFARFLNLRLEVVLTSWDENLSRNGVIPHDLKENPNISYTPDALRKADFICGTIYIFDWRKRLFDYAGIFQVSDLLVIRKKNKEITSIINNFLPIDLPDNILTKEIKTIKDLSGTTIAAMGNTSYIINLTQINEKLGNTIKIISCTSEDEAQKMFLEGKVDGFVTVSTLALEFINNNPNIAKLAFPIGRPVDVGWTVEKNNYALAEEINNFFETIIGTGQLDNIFQQIYGINYNTYLDIINSYSDATETDLRSYEDIVNSRKLIVALRQRDMIFHSEGKKQFSHLLIEDFARFLNLDLEIVPIKSISEIFAADDGKIYTDSAYTPKLLKQVDIVCDILAPTNWRLSKVDIVGYLPNAIIVVGKKNLKITTIQDLRRYKGVTEKGSSYENVLQKNKIKNYDYAPAASSIKLVENGKYDYTLVSIDIYELSKYQNIEAKFIIGEIEFAGWAIRKNDPKLKQKILEFFDLVKRNGTLDNYFKQQTGIAFKAAEKFLNALHQTYNIGFFPFTNYGTDNGLISEKINAIYQDKKSHIWFASKNGLIRYNGRRMEVFTTSNNLIGNYIYDIKQDNDDIYYIATQKGISFMNNSKIDTLIADYPYTGIYIDAFNNKFFYGQSDIAVYNNKEIIHINSLNNNKLSNINHITQLPNQKVYLISTDNGLFILNLDNKLIKTISYEPTYYTFIDNDNNVWVSNRAGLYYNDLSKVIQAQLGAPINSKINVFEKIYKIVQTKDEAIWLVGNYEIYQVFSINLSTIKYDYSIGFKPQKINDFFVDKEDDIWIAYDNGVKKLTNKSLRVIYPNHINFNLKQIQLDDQNNFIILANNNIFLFTDTLNNLSYLISSRPLAFSLQNNKLFVCTEKEIQLVDYINQKSQILYTFNEILDNINLIYVDNRENIFITINNSTKCLFVSKDRVISIVNSPSSIIYDIKQIDDKVYFATSEGLAVWDDEKLNYIQKTNFSIYTIKKIDKIIYLGTQNGLYVFENGKIIRKEIRFLSNISINSIEVANETGYLWLGTNRGLNYVDIIQLKSELFIDKKDGLPGDEIVINGVVKDLKGLIWIATKHGLATFDIKKIGREKRFPDCSIEKFILNSVIVDSFPYNLSHNQNNITFEISGLSFKNEQAIVYDYYLRGNDKIYESLSQVPYIAAYQNLPPGNYTFLYRTKGKDGIWSYYQAISFTIQKPWWMRWWAIISFVISAVLIVYIIIKWREKALKAKNEMLERIVEERTKEIVKQKSEIEEKNAELEQQQEEILAQRDELARQKEIAEEQRDQIAKQKEEIMDSIYYAKRIQNAILPPKDIVNQILPENFILYLPRDIVSGDFYWIKKINNYIVVATADCTGHGVPGAFMSMLGVSLLNEIVLRNIDTLDTGLMLNELRESVVHSLHQTGKIEEAKDGMDMSLYILDIDNHKLIFSGAFNSMIVCRDEEIITLQANRMPIGIFEEENPTPFTTTTFDVRQGDVLYTFSDGYASQFGGPNGKKFKQSRFEKLLQTVKDKPMSEQKNILDITLKTWMGVKYSQVDDIIVIGVRYIW